MLISTITSLLICLLTFNVAIAQDKTFNKYIENGIALHDEGQYLQAIKQYEKALKIDKKSALAYYEIALSHYALDNKKSALKYANKAFKSRGGQDMPMLYEMKGSLLDDMGKAKQAIKVYQKGIQRFPDDHLLHFNMGITYARMNMQNKAKNAFITTISKNYSHPSSHYYLGKMMEEQGRKIPAIMSYYFFLMLEPETLRADEIYDKLMNLLIKSESEVGNQKIEINLGAGDMSELEFTPMELLLYIDITKEEGEEEIPKTDTEKLIAKTTLLFSAMKEKDDGKQGIWWDFYAPYYAHLAECEVITAFCHHIGLSKGGDIALWMEAHEEEAIDFVNCVNEYGN